MGKIINLIGKKFEYLTILEKVTSKNKQVYWKCICKCGKILNLRSQDLRRKHTVSCGCMKYILISKKLVKDISGKIFGKLTVIKRSIPTKNGLKWKCFCQCGKISFVLGHALKTGNTKSCGCEKKVPINKFIISNDYDINKIIKLYVSYIPIRDIAKNYNVSLSTIIRLLKRNKAERL